MRIGFYGLGRMGHNMVLNLLDKRYEVVASNRSKEPISEISKKGAIGAYSIDKFCEMIPKPRIIWMMVSAGKPVDELIEKIVPLIDKGDILIDGGNSNYVDTVRRFKRLRSKGINFIDCGTSGGLNGARNGACLTIGGDKNVFKKIEFLFRDLAIKNGYLYTGKSGSGHFVKTVHNGIEYVILEALGEGFDVLNSGEYELDFKKIAEVWSNGSIIRSYLTKIAIKVFEKDPLLKGIKGVIGGGETGKWVLEYAKRWKVPVPALESALRMRKVSAKQERFSGKVIAALRNEFGGHSVVSNVAVK